MSEPKNKIKKYNLYYLLYLSFESEQAIRKILEKDCDIKPEFIQRGLHLTIYHSRRPLDNLKNKTSFLEIKSNTEETRFMVLAPGGENPRPNIDPASHGVGIRLTRRNVAINHILKLRRDVYKLEPKFNNRENTTAWTNAYGARHFQPHIKLVRAGSGIDSDLTILGKTFREKIKNLEFSKAQFKIYT